MKEVKTMVKSEYLKYPIFSNDTRVLNELGVKTDSVKFSARYGKWSMIEYCTIISEFENCDVCMNYCCVIGLFEHDTYGDMTDHVLAYYDVFSGDNCWKEIDGTYDDIRTALIDNEIVEA